jgi:prepilin-type N-terminal cleavage/methylation domain-containing protein
MTMRRTGEQRASGDLPAGNGGFTLVELMIVGIIGAIILLAAFSMYLTSLDTWDTSGARLALQRNGDRAVKQIAFDIRRGDFVTVSPDSTAIVVTRTTSSAVDTLAAYALVSDEVVNIHGTVLTDHVTDLRFSSSNGVKVWISMTLADDMGTGALPFDDQRVEINSLAVCRNEPT